MTPRASLPAGLSGALRSGVLVPLWLVCSLVAPATAQPPTPTASSAPQQAQQQEDGEQRAPAYIAAIEGTARLDREGQTETVERGLPLVEGDRLRTDAGRVEVAFPDGTQLYLDRFAELDLVQPHLVRLARGRVFVRLSATRSHPERLEIEAPGATVRFLDDGEYRVAVGGTDGVDVEVAAIRGSAEIASDDGAVQVAAGQRAAVRDGQAPSAPEWFNAANATTLERWAQEREALWQSGGYASRTHLPNELVSYASTFDQYGSWQVDATYGQVWYPTADPDWRPYYNGRWTHSARYGWTWIAYDPWGWPTHHYGRWDVGGRGWFWIPARRWGPAWVYWATAPGYVGWCPLGWNGRPVLNVFSYTNHRYPRHRDPYRAWTVIPRDQFGRGRVPFVRADRTILDRDRPNFALQHVPPGFAPPRSPYGRAAGVARGPGISTMAPRASESDNGRSGRSGTAPGSARPRTTDAATAPYERAREYMPRPGSGDRAPSRAPYGVTRRTGDADAGDDASSGGSYRRVPSDQSPTRAPYGVRRTPSETTGSPRGRDDNPSPGYASPRQRAPDSPGRSRPPDSGPRPGMSSPPPERGGSYAAPRGGRSDGGGSQRSAPPPSSRPSSGGESRGGGGARRRP